MGDQPVVRPLPYTSEHKQNKRTQASMSRGEFEPTTTVLESATTVCALDRSVTVIGTVGFLVKNGQVNDSFCFQLGQEPNLLPLIGELSSG
jgi:hypothetical protein